MADKIVVLNEGRVEQVGPPLELYRRPATQFVAGFIGAPSMNFLSVEVRDGSVVYNDRPIVPYAAQPGSAEAQPVSMGVRPEHIEVGVLDSATLNAVVVVTESLGGESYLYMDTDSGDRLVVKTTGEDTTAPGDKVGLRLPANRLHFFDEQGVALTR